MPRVHQAALAEGSPLALALGCRQVLRVAVGYRSVQEMLWGVLGVP